ncbi:cyclic-phosphate processing receiver domain-containing protein [Amycolatopsis sp. NPDC051716]|uniref:cyclic-phosphate processing receiver domain-containing protein n=1 Tax=Amycolatopsis sp. NPDC051716 TaxID=3155804 RepID=UPI00341B757F
MGRLRKEVQRPQGRPVSDGDFAAISLDHDLGGDHTTHPVVLWRCEHDHRPPEARIHTANPVAREWPTAMPRRYGPGVR